MTLIKKITAGICAAALTFSLCSCSTNLWGGDISYAAVIDGVEIPAGVFIAFQSQAFSDAQAYTSEDATPSADIVTSAEIAVSPEETTATSATTAFTDKIIEGKDVTTWINDKATDYMREYVAVQKKFEELGLKFENKEEQKAAANAESFWEYAGTYYEGLGISMHSFELMLINQYQEDILFDYYYGEGGEKEIAKTEITDYIYANNAKIDYIEMALKDGSGNLLKSAGKEEIKKMAEGYIDRAQGGEDFNAILKEYNDYYAKLQADAAAAETDAAADASTETATAETDTAETAEETPDNTTVITKDGGIPSTAVDQKVFDGSVKLGDVFLVEEDEVYYIVKLDDILGEGSTYYDDNADTVRHTLKDEEFDETVKGWTDGQNAELNEAAYKAYKINKFMD